MPFARRVAPAVLLAVLSPLVAEFLLGDFTVKAFATLIALIPLYGGGALLIREVARRAGRGWPSIVLLGVAYALVEEAFLTQSLFNPDYVGQRLLDYGYVPALGTSLNWSVFVLSIHVVWSIATPILIAENLAGDRSTRAWLRWPGLAVTTLLFLVGCAATTAFSLKASPFVATRLQFLVAGVLVALAIAGVFIARARDVNRRSASNAPRPLFVFAVTLALAVVFMGVETRARMLGLSPPVSLTVRVAALAAAAWSIVRWSRTRGWAAAHLRALAAATTLTYASFGLAAFLQGHTHLGVPTDGVDVAGQIALTAVVLLAIGLGGRAVPQTARPR